MDLPSRIGFGVSGAHGTPLVSPAKTCALIEEAVGLGVRVFDTAPAYGTGEAERRLGRALMGLDRDSICVSTKAGLSSSGLAGRHRDFTPDGIEASVRASLDRLQLDGVDILFLHGADLDELTEALFERLNVLKSAGAFRWLGAAGRGPELGAAIQSGQFQAIMAPVHPFLSQREDQWLLDAAEAGLDVFAIETSGDSPGSVRMPRRGADVYRLAKQLRAAPGRGRIDVEEGLQAALHREDVTCVMMTTTQSAHLKANAALA